MSEWPGPAPADDRNGRGPTPHPDRIAAQDRVAEGRRGPGGSYDVTHRSILRLAAMPFVAGLLLLAGSPAFARGAPDSFADLAEKLLPAVVNIATTQKVTDASKNDPNLEELFKQFFARQNPDNNGGGDNGGGEKERKR